jgi:hypothetical protein
MTPEEDAGLRARCKAWLADHVPVRSALLARTNQDVDALVRLIQAELAAEAKACAMVAKTFTKGYDISRWMEQSKQDVAKHMCLDVAEAIEQRIAGGETKS